MPPTETFMRNLDSMLVVVSYETKIYIIPPEEIKPEIM